MCLKEAGKDGKYLSSLYLRQCGWGCNTANDRWRALYNINSINFVIFNTGFCAIQEILRGRGNFLGVSWMGKNPLKPVMLCKSNTGFTVR